MELKLIKRICPSQIQPPTNRTIMELKQLCILKTAGEVVATNRTIMELKLVAVKVSRNDDVVY